MPNQSSWTNNWDNQTNTALAQLSAVKRQFNSDINTRMRMLRSARQINPTEAPTHLQTLVRAPLAGLR